MKTLDGTVLLNIHYSWRRDNPHKLTVEPDEIFEIKIPDSSTLQIKPNFTSSDLGSIDSSKFDAAVGPVYVDGAKPGDTLEVILEDIRVDSWGWSAILKDFGLLKGLFEETLVVWDIGSRGAVARNDFLSGVTVPVRPFLGVVGAAPSEGEFEMIPPRHFGGNLDNRLFTKGASLLLPVSVEGGLVSFADPHASQGDGEVCGTAIETSAVVKVRINVLKNFSLRAPMIRSSVDETGKVVATMGISHDLYIAAREAALQMVDYLSARGFTKEEAYVLSSVAGSLRISEIVDEPNYVVTLAMPESLTERRG